jgi:hypothetical protein
MSAKLTEQEQSYAARLVSKQPEDSWVQTVDFAGNQAGHYVQVDKAQLYAELTARMVAAKQQILEGEIDSCSGDTHPLVPCASYCEGRKGQLPHPLNYVVYGNQWFCFVCDGYMGAGL